MTALHGPLLDSSPRRPTASAAHPGKCTSLAGQPRRVVNPAGSHPAIELAITRFVATLFVATVSASIIFLLM